MTDDEPATFDQLLEQSMEELRLKTQAHDATWHLGEADWQIDQDAGVIVFTTPYGMKATCAVQIIGTYNTQDHSWLWGWDHPSVEAPLQEHAALCYAFGEENQIDFLTAQQLQLSGEEDAWQLTALACKLSGADGAYRGPVGNTMVYVTFSDVVLSKTEGD